MYGLRSKSADRIRSPGIVHAIPPLLSNLFQEVPSSVFSKPDAIFHAPERIFNNLTMRDLVNARQEVLTSHPLGVIVVGAITVLVLLEATLRVYGGGELSSTDEEDGPQGEGIVPTQSMEDFMEKINDLEKLNEYDENNRALQWLAGVAAVAFWMAGFLNSSSLSP